MKQALSEIGKGDQVSVQRITDFGFWTTPEDALEMFLMLHHHNILPAAGGWQDQSEEIRDDLLMMLALYSEAVRDAKEGKALPPDPDATERKTRRRPPSLEDL